MLFKEVVGHTEIKENLIITVKENTISHAQLFSGKEGYGHFSLAIAYAQYILCNEPNESDSCGLCASCKKVGQFSHPDLHFSFPVHLSKANKINQSDDMLSEFRAMLLEDIHIGKNHWYDLMGNQNKQGVIGVTESESIVKKLSLKSFEGGYKILIMWLPESMNINAANKLLKIIEEPPASTLYLLVTDEKERIINTILSRTQCLHIPQVDLEEIKGYLDDKFNLKEEDLKHYSKLANGNIHKAKLAIEAQEETHKHLKEFTTWMRLCYSRNITETIDWVDKMNGYGREVQKDFLLFTLDMFRQSFIGHYSGESLLSLSKEQKQFLSKFSSFIHHKNITEFHQEINKAYYHLERNANAKVLFLDVSLKIYSLLKRSSVDS